MPYRNYRAFYLSNIASDCRELMAYLEGFNHFMCTSSSYDNPRLFTCIGNKIMVIFNLIAGKIITFILIPYNSGAHKLDVYNVKELL